MKRTLFCGELIAFAVLLLSWICFAAAAQTLPLSIKVDLSGFANLDDNDLGQDGLVQLSTEFITDYVSSGLLEQVPQRWTLDNNAENELLVSLAPRSEGGEIKMRFLFSETGMPVFTHHGKEEIGFPSYANFAERLEREIEAGMFATWPKIDQTLNKIHALWDTGEQTEIVIDHQLDLEHDHVFSKTRVKLVLGEQSVLHLKRDENNVAYKRMIATKPSFSVDGLVRPMRLDGYRTKEEYVGRFCMKRQPDAVASANMPSVGYTCPLSGTCESGNIAPSGWVIPRCQRDQGFLFDLENRLTHLLPGLVSPALASQPAPEHWSVPSLDSLHDRLADNSARLTGFTDFSISTRNPLNLKKPADEVSLELSANNVPIWLDGVPPSENREPVRASRGLSLRFGLQNLHLGSRGNGCEVLDARLVFYKDNQPTGEEVLLKRGYAALRHPADRTISTEIGDLQWQGRYYQPAHTGESGIFLASKKYDRNDPKDRDEALQYLESLRLQLERANLTIDVNRLGGTLGLPAILRNSKEREDLRLSVIGKIRPPRNPFSDGRYAYGLQIAVQQTNGLLQFTFDEAQIESLKQLLLDVRSKDRSLHSFIPEKSKDFYVYRYTEKRNIGPGWICELR